MPVKRELSLKDEEGTSMVELVVGMGMGMVVLAGLSILLIVTMRGNARVDARAEASDNARVTMTRIMEQLHSACVSPTIPPVQYGSGATTLVFKHGTYGGQAAASAEATTTTITYSSKESGSLWQTDKTAAGKEEPSRLLLAHVSLPASEQSKGRIFQYANNTVQASTFEGTGAGHTLEPPEAEKTILVTVAFKARPKSEPIADAGSATEIENSATLRLTPPVYEEGKQAKPCE
jgi:hypothetical protein